MLRQAFEVYGEVTDAFVAYNGRSSRGFGYVTFKEAAGAALAVSCRGPPPPPPPSLVRRVVSLARRAQPAAAAPPPRAQVEKMNGQPLGDDDRSREIRVEMARERPGPRPEPREPRSGGNSER